MGTSSHLAMLSKGPEVWRKDSKVLRKLKGGAVGMGTPLQILIPALSSQVTQLQQVHADWRQRLHRTVAPAVPVCGREGSKAGWKEGAQPLQGWEGKCREKAGRRVGREEPWNPLAVGWVGGHFSHVPVTLPNIPSHLLWCDVCCPLRKPVSGSYAIVWPWMLGNHCWGDGLGL